MTNTAPTGPRPAAPLWQRVLLWLVTIVCFAWLYTRIDGAAARQGLTAASYLLQVFASVSWGTWLALMIPYSVFFFLVDSTVVWRVVTWFNARVPWTGILPIRASAYIISIVNEQVGKGAMALYLNRRDGVPGWEVGSSMLFIMFCELLYLTFWANVGYWMAADTLPAVFGLVPWIGLGVLVLFLLWVAYFRALGRLLPRRHPGGQNPPGAIDPEGVPRGVAAALRYRRRHPLARPPGRRRGLHAGAAPVRR